MIRDLERFREELRAIARSLYERGFNVIPVVEKRPLCSWSPQRRLEWEVIEKNIEKATGLALCAGIGNIIIIDIDKFEAFDKALWLRDLLKETIVWKTGPRCPNCGGKNIINENRMLKCLTCSKEQEYYFEQESSLRGFGAAFRVSSEMLEKLRGTMRLGEIEILVNNYALIPPSIHPSGISYEWINQPRWDREDLGIRELSEEELSRIIETFKEEEEKEAREEKEVRSVLPHGLIELSDEEIEELVQTLEKIYVEGERQNVWLYFSGMMGWKKISPVSTLKVLKRLYDLKRDDDPIKERLSALTYSYEKLGIKIGDFANEIREIVGDIDIPGPKDLDKLDAEVAGASKLKEIAQRVFNDEEKADVFIQLLTERVSAAVSRKRRKRWEDEVVDGFRFLSDYKVNWIIQKLTAPTKT